MFTSTSTTVRSYTQEEADFFETAYYTTPAYAEDTTVDAAEMHYGFDLMLVNMQAVGQVKRMKYQTTAQLRKASTQRLQNLYVKLFGVSSDSRDQMFWAVNNWMENQMIALINAFCGIDAEKALCISEIENYLSFKSALAAAYKWQGMVESKRVVEDNIVLAVKKLLAEGFTCAAIGNLGIGVSAKQASRMKRGRRYSDVSGIEQQIPVARQFSPELAVFA